MTQAPPKNSLAPRSAPTLLGRVRRLPPVEWLVSYLFGDDVFISYSRHDGVRYGEELAHVLADAGYSVRMDLWETEAGEETPEKVMRGLRRSRALVVVATPRALQSPNVAGEVAAFRLVRSRDMVNLITFGRGVPDALWSEHVGGLPWLEDTPEALAAAAPSAEVVKRIRASLRFTRRNRRLFKASVASLVALLVLLALGAGTTVYAVMKVGEAAQATMDAAVAAKEAQAQQEAARLSAAEAERQRVAAREAKEAADAQSLEAERQRQEADKQSKRAASADLQRQAAERATAAARRLEEQARRNAAEQQRIAYSRRLAGHADRSMSERLDLGLLLGAAAYDAQDATRPTFEAMRVLLTPFTYYKNLAFVLRPSDDRKERFSHVAATDDGRTVVAARADGNLTFWDVKTRRERAADSETFGGSAGLALTPDGLTLATTGHDGKLVVWDVLKGVPRSVVGSKSDGRPMPRSWREPQPQCPRVAALDDRTIVTSGAEDELRFWDIGNPDSPRLLRQFSLGKDEKGEQKRLSCLSAGAGGRRLAAGGEQGFVRLLDVTNVRESDPRLLKELKDGESRLERVAYSHDGKFLAAINGKGELIVWGGGSASEVPTQLAHYADNAGAKVRSIAFNRDATLLLVSKSSGRVEAHPMTTDGQSQVRGLDTIGLYPPGVGAAAFSADSRHVITGNDDGTLMFWNTETRGLLTREFEGPDNNTVRRTAFTPDGRLMASGDDAGTVALTDLTAREPKASPLAPRAHAAKVTGLAFAPGGELLASGDDNGGLVVWSRRGGGDWRPSPLHVKGFEPAARPGEFIVNPDAVSLVAFADGGRKLVSVGPGARVIVWDVASRTALRTMSLPGGGTDAGVPAPQGVAVSPDGGKLAMGHGENSLYLLDITRHGSQPQSLEGHRRMVSNVAFSGDGRRLASVDDGGEGIIWDLGAPAPRCVARFRARPLQEDPNDTFSAGINAIAFGQGDATLVLGGGGVIILLDVESNSPIGLLVDEKFDANVSFSPDGNTISFGSTGMIVTLDINPASWARHAREIANRPLAAWEREQFMAGSSEATPECGATPRERKPPEAEAPLPPWRRSRGR